MIRSLKGDSGVGTDMLSAWLLKAGGRTVAVIVLELVNDIIKAKHVPMAWRGGRLVVLFKGKGSPADPDSYRGILVLDHLGKILTSLLQQNLEDIYVDGVGACQFGAVKHSGTSMASLFLYSVALGRCYFVLFLDLTKAFDHAVREVVMGWMRSHGATNATEKPLIPRNLGSPATLWMRSLIGLTSQVAYSSSLVLIHLFTPL